MSTREAHTTRHTVLWVVLLLLLQTINTVERAQRVSPTITHDRLWLDGAHTTHWTCCYWTTRQKQHTFLYEAKCNQGTGQFKAGHAMPCSDSSIAARPIRSWFLFLFFSFYFLLSLLNSSFHTSNTYIYMYSMCTYMERAIVFARIQNNVLQQSIEGKREEEGRSRDVEMWCWCWCWYWCWCLVRSALSHLPSCATCIRKNRREKQKHKKIIIEIENIK